jgi:hypothetical protein
MEDKMFRFKFIVLTVMVLVIGIIAAQPLYEDKKPIVAMSRENYEIQTHTIDSLQNIIDNLQGEQEVRNKIRDEEVETLKILVGKYEFGLSGLDKANRKEFIRYAMFSEDYSERVNEDYFEENHKLKQKARYADYK